MARLSRHPDLPLQLDPRRPRQLALYEALRTAILGGRLAPLDELPSTRELAAQLGTSRGTVVAVFEQLRGEGYLSARRGSGTVVAEQLPDSTFTSPAPGSPPSHTGALHLSRWAQTLESPFPLVPGRAPRPFRPHLPAVDAFPLEQWTTLVARRAKRDDGLWLGSGDASGYLPLRRALAEHLRLSRGIATSAERIVILPSAQQALDLTARLVIERGEAVWMEDPGYVGARAAFEASGAKVVPVPVDERGLLVSAGVKRAVRARLAYVTPGHQWPLGVTLAIERRLELLEWARASRSLVLEDDYDSEYRYEGRPVPALKSLDTDDRVLHVGAFSKTLLPSLRLAYAVVPERLLPSFVAAKSIVDRHTPVLGQAALTDFFEEGHFGRHLRRMRVLYAERRGALLDALSRELGGLAEPIGARAGLGLAVRLPATVPDVGLVKALAEVRLEATALSPYALRRRDLNGLLLGFAPFSPARLRNAVEALARALPHLAI